MSVDERPLPAGALAPVALADALGELGAGVDLAARELDQFQAIVLDLLARAGATADAGAIQDAQRIDPLVQRLHRLAASVQDIAAAVRASPAAGLGLVLDPAAQRRLSHADEAAPSNAGDVDLF